MYFSIQWVQWRLLTVEEKSCGFVFESVNHHLVELMQVSELKATNIIVPNYQCYYVAELMLSLIVTSCFVFPPPTICGSLCFVIRALQMTWSNSLREGSALSLICVRVLEC